MRQRQEQAQPGATVAREEGGPCPLLLTREQFYKSMTSDASSAVWQDVYHVPWGRPA